MTPEKIAEVVHEANRALQRINGEIVNFPWESTSQELRDSSISGVLGVQNGNTPEQSHEGWMRERTENGWVYGPVKNFALKTHPDLVPYADLPPEQKVKDALFGAIVHALS